MLSFSFTVFMVVLRSNADYTFLFSVYSGLAEILTKFNKHIFGNVVATILSIIIVNGRKLYGSHTNHIMQ